LNEFITNQGEGKKRKEKEKEKERKRKRKEKREKKKRKEKEKRKRGMKKRKEKEKRKRKKKRKIRLSLLDIFKKSLSFLSAIASLRLPLVLPRLLHHSTTTSSSLLHPHRVTMFKNMFSSSKSSNTGDTSQKPLSEDDLANNPTYTWDLLKVRQTVNNVAPLPLDHPATPGHLRFGLASLIFADLFSFLLDFFRWKSRSVLSWAFTFLMCCQFLNGF